jgi:hypothetical protein
VSSMHVIAEMHTVQDAGICAATIATKANVSKRHEYDTEK